ncbi:hypothetical protein HYC85_016981 [Camellia sinensis]|uniref:non-specific serine/threonine protein kinase n=1 Tax=Camellia sinensis TaxID=4442 RepID=A0A7J7H189_CAMSI|nr:hypothetical protein HYC85_016981 [Camellia sinensis]
MASASLGNGRVGSSRTVNGFKGSSSSVDWLGREMLEMRLRDKVDQDDDRDSEPDIIDGVGAEAGHVIRTTIGGRNGQPKQIVSYITEHVVGTGSFGVVYQAKCRETGEIVAIKKVLQDKHYKNRELQIMQMLDHPNVVSLKHCFFSTTDKEELYLNLVLEFVPETVNRIARQYSRINQRMPLIYICRGLAYMHNCIGICHRDIKPQNLLVNPHSHQLKLCDFGSAKVLVKGEPNVSYICSRYYRAPELIFGATEYTTAIDIWSTGCVMAELLLGQVLGTPTREEIKCMNPNYTEFKSSRNICLQKLLTWCAACIHPFFDELRDPNTRLPNGRPLPPLFNFKAQELSGIPSETLRRLVPEHARKQNFSCSMVCVFEVVSVAVVWSRINVEEMKNSNFHMYFPQKLKKKKKRPQV